MSLNRKYTASCWLWILVIILFPFSVQAATFSTGTTNTFTSSASNDVGVKLDSTHIIAAYTKSGAGVAAVAVVDGTTLTFGSEYQFCASSCSNIGIAMLDSTHVMIVYSISGTGRALIATISGTTITFGADTTFDTSLRSGVTTLAATAMDSTHVAITYVTGSSPFTTKVIAATVSGDSISFGTATTLQSTSGQYTAITAMDSTHFIVMYQQNDSTPHISAASVSGNSMSFGSSITFSGYNSDPSITKLDATHAVVTYRSTSGDNPYSFVLTMSDTSLSAASSQAVASVSGYYPYAAALDSTHLVLMLRNNDSGDFATYAAELTVSGDTITADALVLALNTILSNSSRIAIPLDSTSAFILASNKAGVVTTDTTAPSAVSSFTAVANNGSVTFNWVNPVDADFYSTTIRRSTTSYPLTATGDTLAASGVTGTSTTDDGLSSGTYYYSIFARDLRGNFSTAANATVLVSVSPSGGGGTAAWLFDLRKQNGLDANGKPLSSSSSSSASSTSSAASETTSHQAAMSSSVSSSFSSSTSSSSSVITQSPLQIRTCERVMKWFRGNDSVLGRLNVRLLKHFGFECRS